MERHLGEYSSPQCGHDAAFLLTTTHEGDAMSALLASADEQRQDGDGARARMTLPYPKFRKTDQIPWKPWVMQGVEYKLLSVNSRNGGFTCMLKVLPGVEAPIHQHIGAIEVMVLEGDVYYERSCIGRPGDYIFEPAGDIHQPHTDNGCVLFAVFDGPIAGLAADGSIAGIVDYKMMLEMAERDGVAEGVDR
jgi:2,4'-dihydroxyacetophenone dioxygenase